MNDDRLMDHRYDDIQEYDNPLPAWWTLIFIATIIWGIAYELNVIPGVGEGRGRKANYEAEMAAAAKKYGTQAPVAGAKLDPAALVAAVADPARIAAGKQTFTTTCAPCHGMDGGGSIGPNLTDDWWIHSPSYTGLLKTISEGVPDKGMPTWSAVLKPEQIVDVAAYVTTLHGTKPAQPKAAQGEEQGAPRPDEPGEPEHDHSAHQ